MKLLLDLNVLLDLVLDRAPWVEDAKAITQRVLSGSDRGFVAASSFPTLFYLVRKTAGVERAALSVQRCVATFEVAGVTYATLRRALQLPGPDFEDNVQIAAALEAGLDLIVTRDTAHFAAAELEVLSPSEFVARVG